MRKKLLLLAGVLALAVACEVIDRVDHLEDRLDFHQDVHAAPGTP